MYVHTIRNRMKKVMHVRTTKHFRKKTQKHQFQKPSTIKQQNSEDGVLFSSLLSNNHGESLILEN